MNAFSNVSQSVTEKESYKALFVCFWRESPKRAKVSSFTKFTDHTQRRTTVGRTPLDE